MHLKNDIICFVQAAQKPREKLSATLGRLLKNKKKTLDFLTTIIQNPRANKGAYRYFYASFKTKPDCHQWYEDYLKVCSNQQL